MSVLASAAPLLNSGVFARVRDVLAARWAAGDQADPVVACRLVDMHRALGDLDAARAVLAQSCALDHAGLRRLAACLGPSWPGDDAVSGAGPVPFHCIDNLVSAADAHWLLQDAMTEPGVYRDAGIEQFHADPSEPGHPRSTMSAISGSTDLARKALTRPLPTAVRARVLGWLRDPLTAVTTRLGVALPRTTITLKYSASRDGDYFLPHSDAGIAGRILSFAWYLHQVLCPFTGGGLALFDTGAAADGGGAFSGMTQIRCRHNRLVIFKSSAVHEVLPVRGHSIGQSPLRYAITGHVQMENRTGLPVDAEVTVATGRAG